MVASNATAVDSFPASSTSCWMLLANLVCSSASLSATSSPCACCASSFMIVAVSLSTLFLILPRCFGFDSRQSLSVVSTHISPVQNGCSITHLQGICLLSASRLDGRVESICLGIVGDLVDLVQEVQVCFLHLGQISR